MKSKRDVKQPADRSGFLPVSRADMEALQIDRLDFVYVTGDAYVDHPSFGHAIISRVLVSRGFTVGIIAQPDWNDPESVTVLGEPRLAFLVSSGNMDSMVNHYTVSRKRRGEDLYSPGGAVGKRPDRAVIVYANLIRRTYKQTPVIAGGIEASLRRMAHYDYWSDSLRRSVLMDCGVDLISYGMGEHSIVEIAEALDAGIPVQEITYIAGTCFKTKDPGRLDDCEMLPSYETLLESKREVAKSFYTQYTNTDPFRGKRLAESYGSVYVVQNPPARPLTTQEMDDIYDLPYMRRAHPDYDQLGGIPATKEIQFSLVSNRGCFGGCSFCALTFHQGRIVQVRSHDSIIREAVQMTNDPDFKGYIHDVGGPTANFRAPSCKKQMSKGVCPDRQCLFPAPCKNLQVSHQDYISLLRSLRTLPGVKKVFIRSGIRFDYVMADPSDAFLRELVQYHVSGQLKVAPEHVSDRVLRVLGKPEHAVYEAFVRKYEKLNHEYNMRQYLVPYLMSSHPGCTLKDAVMLSEYLKSTGHKPEQVQDFYPTPSTLSTCMYYTGLDPRNMKPVYVPKDPHEKAMQRALMQFTLPYNRKLVEEALHLVHREDLIGYGPKCLIRPSGTPDGKTMHHPAGHNSGRTGSQSSGRHDSARQKRDHLGKPSENRTGKHTEKHIEKHTEKRTEKHTGKHTERYSAKNMNKRTQRDTAERFQKH